VASRESTSARRTNVSSHPLPLDLNHICRLAPQVDPASATRTLSTHASRLYHMTDRKARARQEGAAARIVRLTSRTQANQDIAYYDGEEAGLRRCDDPRPWKKTAPLTVPQSPKVGFPVLPGRHGVSDCQGAPAFLLSCRKLLTSSGVRELTYLHDCGVERGQHTRWATTCSARFSPAYSRRAGRSLAG
jgi:hypothetical protein